jgi:hypothetical protein
VTAAAATSHRLIVYPIERPQSQNVPSSSVLYNTQLNNAKPPDINFEQILDIVKIPVTACESVKELIS